MTAAAHAFHFWTWLGHFFGVSDEAGPGYGFFSGIGSDIGEVVLIPAAFLWLRKHNCREHGCWRIGLHTYVDADNTPHPACRRHHPTVSRHRHLHFDVLHRAKQRAAP